MSITPAVIVFAMVIVAGFVVWARFNSLQCVTCGRVHLTESEIYRCDECGKSFCRDRAAHGERNSVSSQGRFSSAFASSLKSVSYGGDNCGVVYEVVSNGKKKPNDYLCRQHAQMR